MNKRVELPRALVDRSFTVAEATEHGVGRDRLRARDLVQPHHGVRAPAGAVRTTAERARALLPALRPDQFFSHSTAAELWGIPLPRRFSQQDELHVTTPGARHGMRRPGVIGHVTRAAEPVVHLALPVSDPVRTWVELATQLSILDLVVAGDALVGRQVGRASIPALRAAVSAPGLPRSAGRARRAVDLVRVGAESAKETETRLLLPASLRAVVELNVRVFAGRQYLGRPDLLFIDAMLVVEYEGDHHRTDRAVFRQDVDRRERFAQHGWRVFQVTQDHLADAARLGRRLETIVRSRAGWGTTLRREARDGLLWAVHG